MLNFTTSFYSARHFARLVRDRLHHVVDERLPVHPFREGLARSTPRSNDAFGIPPLSVRDQALLNRLRELLWHLRRTYASPAPGLSIGHFQINPILELLACMGASLGVVAGDVDGIIKDASARLMSISRRIDRQPQGWKNLHKEVGAVIAVLGKLDEMLAQGAQASAAAGPLRVTRGRA